MINKMNNKNEMKKVSLRPKTWIFLKHHEYHAMLYPLPSGTTAFHETACPLWTGYVFIQREY